MRLGQLEDIRFVPVVPVSRSTLACWSFIFIFVTILLTFSLLSVVLADSMNSSTVSGRFSSSLTVVWADCTNFPFC
jgi:hypothetical protein